MKKKLWLSLFLALGCTACGTQWSGNYTGTWSGGVSTSSPITATSFSMTLYQSGSNVNGYWLATGGTQGFAPPSGQIQGTVNGNNLTATLTVPAGQTTTTPGTGTYTGTLTLNNNTLGGSVSGAQTTPVQGTFSAQMSLTQSR